MKAGLLPLPHAFPEFQTSLHRLFCARRCFHKLSRVPRRKLVNSKGASVAKMDEKTGYEKWTQAQLITRIQELESQIPKLPAPSPIPLSTTIPASATDEHPPIPYRKPPKQPPKPFDASKYSTRLIALKFAYLGQGYNGFEHHSGNKTPLPTVEEELWKGLVKTRLISPAPIEGKDDRGKGYERMGKEMEQRWERDGVDVNWEGCEYSKCGRTDRGVSAFGQVIGVRVRSNKPLPPSLTPSPVPADLVAAEADPVVLVGQELETPPPLDDVAKVVEEREWDEKDELPYIQLLNRVLPPDIRVYAWCPNPPPDFSARFSCKERRYRYFFTNPAFAPVSGSSSLYTTTTEEGGELKKIREGWLDINAMREGCKRLEGLHDFRNMCKIDASKQLTNFKRRIFYADIEEVSPLSLPAFLLHPALQYNAAVETPKMYSFTLHGSAFLWHQVRSIVAILFLIGQGLESPSLITNLLDIETNPKRPKYEMASDAPLVLWDCVFPSPDEVESSEIREKGYEDRLEWVYVGDAGAIEPKSSRAGVTIGRGKWGRGGVIDDVWELWRGHKMNETLSSLLLDTIAARGKSTLDAEGMEGMEGDGGLKNGPRVFDGADVGRAKGKYVPVLERERQEPVEVVNERYAKRKGLRAEQMLSKEEDADE